MTERRAFNIGIVGATGMVGQTFMNLLAERNFPVDQLKLFASQNSEGKQISFAGRELTIETPKAGAFAGLDLVFFSSGDEISLEWAPQAVKEGAWAVDNSAAFRMNPEFALVVPEVNGHLLKQMKSPQIIANPNCSTIQLVVALRPLQEKFGIRDVRVSSYQAVSGAGLAGHDELMAQIKDHENPSPKALTFPHPILFNVIPQIGGFTDDGYCSEEIKIMKETRKILSEPDLRVSAFTVRVPALNSHSEAVWVTLKTKVEREEVMEALRSFRGITIQDDPTKAVYPTPRAVSGEDDVFVGRVHRDLEDPLLWLMWVVSDNLKKGAALNGIQIAEHLFDIR